MGIRRMLAIGMMLWARPALAAEPVPLAPSSKWQIDYAPTQCRLLRSFGEGDALVTLQLARWGFNDDIDMALAGRRMPTTAAEVPVTVGTTTVDRVPGMHAQGFATDGSPLRSIRFHSDVDLPKALRGDVAAGKPTLLKVRFVRGYSTSLDLGAMRGALAALDSCTDDLVKSWGIDVAAMRTQRSGPQPANDIRTWFTAADYPVQQLRSGGNSRVLMRLIVAADGSVKKCDISGSSGDKTFEDLTCRLAVERARFAPAIGADGHPIASMWGRSIVWMTGEPFFKVQ